MSGILLFVRMLIGPFVDDNGITSWIDDNGITSWIDDAGVVG